MKKFPLDYSASTELIPLFKRSFELCNLRAGETLLIYSDTHTSPHYPAAALGAAIDLGVEAFQVTVPTTVPENDKGIIADIWAGVDMVIDLVSTVAHAYSLLNAAALENGGRVLRCGQPQDVLMRLAPDPVIRRRALAGAGIAAQGGDDARHLRHGHGPDLQRPRQGRPRSLQPGRRARSLGQLAQRHGHRRPG